MTEVQRRQLGDLIVEYANELTDAIAADKAHGGWFYTKDVAADRFVRADPFAWLCGVIFDQRQKYERAWQAPLKLGQRLGEWNVQQISEADEQRLTRVIASPPALHQQAATMAHWIKSAAGRVVDQYGGDAARIWTTASSFSDVAVRLRGFEGIGDKKVQMALGFLLVEKSLALPGSDDINVAVDTHVRRVLRIVGLADGNSTTAIQAAAASLKPTFPGSLDYATWTIGHDWCHANAADCYGRSHSESLFCPLASVCPAARTREPQIGNELRIGQRILATWPAKTGLVDGAYVIEVRDLSGDRVYGGVECDPAERVTLLCDGNGEWSDLSNSCSVKIRTDAEV